MFFKEHNIFHFTKEKSSDNSLFSSIRFIVEACSKDEMKPNLQCIHLKDETLYATCGHRLHIARLHGLNISPILKEGLYFPVKVTKTKVMLVKSDCDWDFPDTSKIISDVNKFKNPKSVRSGHKTNTRALNVFTTVAREVCEGITINYSLLSGANFFPDNNYDVYTEDDGEGFAAVKITNNWLTLIAMPMRT